MAGDLHCHTKLSDGSLGIEELITLAKRRGLSSIAVTDHDTTAGATRAVIIGKRQDIQVIHGIEFSTQDKQRGKKAHVLCYLSDSPDRLEGICRRTCENRKKAAIEIMRKVMRYYPLLPDLVSKYATGSASVFKQHIMHTLMAMGYADSFYGTVYERLFGENGVARVDIDYPDTREIIHAIHEAGGIAVLAHPYLYKNEDMLEEWIAAGLDGVEVWHPSHTEDQTAALWQLAQDNGLVTTGGSDFHGMYTRNPHPLGSTTVPDEAVQGLLNYKKALMKG